MDESSELWLKGPPWLTNENDWPADIMTGLSVEFQAEAKVIKEILATAVQPEQDDLDNLMEKWDLWKTVRITAWIARFGKNCQTKEKTTGPLTTDEINAQLEFWIKRAQDRNRGTKNFEEDKLQLNLQINERDIYECRGRVQGDYPIYVPDEDILAEKLVAHAHSETLHGGVSLTMTKVRGKYWIPRLRRLTKHVIRSCPGCKRFQVKAYADPSTANLPLKRTTGSTPFKIIGVDYAGPIKYLSKARKEQKAYVALYACSLMRAVYLDLLPDQSTEEFLHSLKRFVARKGRSKKIFSDNGKTFVVTANG